jgi:dihydroorotase
MKTKTPNGKPLYITGATLLDPTQKLERAGELLLCDGKILAIGKPKELAAKAKSINATTLDCTGLMLSPGFVDLNAHLPDPGGESRETFASISAAAAIGGFTTLATMPCSVPIHDNAFMTDFILRRAQEHSLVKITPIASVSSGQEGKRLAEIGSMVAAGARACCDVGAALADSYLMRKALEYSRAFDVPIFSFPSDRTLVGQGVIHEGVHSNRLGLRGIPSAAEEIGVYRDTVLARHTGARLHLSSLTTAGAVRAVRRAKQDGLAFTAETNPHYFTLMAEAISSYDTSYKCMPPLRTAEDIAALIEALGDGTLDCIATQHTPQTRSTKMVGFEQASAGILGLETALSLSLQLVKNNQISPLRLVELLSTNPSKVLGLGACYGNLCPNSFADIVIFDPRVSYVLDAASLGSTSRNTPFLDKKLQGRVIYTLVNGTVVFGE